MDFVNFFFKYYDLKKIAFIKTTNVIMIIVKFKNRIWMFTNVWTLIYKWL